MDRYHAGAKGKARIQEAISLLRYGQLVVGYPERPFPEVGLWAKQWQHDHSIVIRLDKPALSTNKTLGGPLGNQYSMSNRAPGWSGLEQMIRLDLSSRNELQLRLTSVLEWVGQAALAPSAPIRLVGLVTALEALLIEESESAGKKTKLATRISRLLAASNEAEIAKEIEELYRTRSECVHAGLMDVEKVEVDRAVALLAKAVEAILTTSPYSVATCLEDILAQIDPPGTRSDAARSSWVAENAYLRWLNDGCPDNRQLQHWLDAEREYVCTTILRGRRLDSFGSSRKADDDQENAG